MNMDYAGYHAVGSRNGITHLGCWAHARRKFKDARKAATRGKKAARNSKVDMALNTIGKLYAIEKQIKDLPDEERQAIRPEKSVPVLQQLRRWLDKSLGSTLPKGLTGKALAYLDKNWDKLTVYVTDG